MSKLRELWIAAETEAGRMEEEIDALRAEVERLSGVSQTQQAFFNAAMDRAEKSEARVAELEAALGEAIKDLEKLGSDSHPGNEYRNGWMNYANESAAAARPALRGEVGE